MRFATIWRTLFGMSVATIDPAAFKPLIASGVPLKILDVRTPAEFARVHASGAVLMPFDSLNPAQIAAQQLGSTEPLYIICQSGGRSTKACQQLQNAGVTSVYSIEGGTTAWERLGLPVVRGGGKVISLERQVRIGAGSLVFIGTLLAWRVHPLFLILPAFVGAGLVFAGISDFCGMGILLSKMPWNKRG